MRRIVLASPTTLIAKELAQQLAASEDLGQSTIDLVSADEKEVGVLAEIGSAAAMVARLDTDEPLEADIVFCCSARHEDALPYLEARSSSTHVVLFATDTPEDSARAYLPWTDFPASGGGATLVAPHPGVVMAASLLQSLEPLRPRAATATLLEPASMKDEAGMDEVLAQTRAMLAFEGQPDPEVFPTQQAFNLNASENLGAALSRQLRIALPTAPRTAFQALRAGTFHAVGLSLEVRFDDLPDLEAVHDALSSTPRHEFWPEHLGTMDAAARENILIGDTSVDRATGSLWIWATADNLTFGIASCGIEVARALLSPSPPN